MSAYTLPEDSKARKDVPLFRGVLRYFPAALAGVAQVSKRGNDKHNPGQEMHHARGKSADHADAIMRHLIDLEDRKAQYNGTEVAKNLLLAEGDALAWRALALSQELHERVGGSPVAPAAVLATGPGVKGRPLDSYPETAEGHCYTIPPVIAVER